MELAFEVVQFFVQNSYVVVSILLVVELAFEDFLAETSAAEHFVSILLVVELAFEAVPFPLGLALQRRFNPSCSGIGF